MGGCAREGGGGAQGGCFRCCLQQDSGPCQQRWTGECLVHGRHDPGGHDNTAPDTFLPDSTVPRKLCQSSSLHLKLKPVHDPSLWAASQGWSVTDTCVLVACRGVPPASWREPPTQPSGGICPKQLPVSRTSHSMAADTTCQQTTNQFVEP